MPVLVRLRARGAGFWPGPCPRGPAHHLGWVQLVPQSGLLAQAESAVSSPVLQPVLHSPLPSLGYTREPMEDSDPRVTARLSVGLKIPGSAWEPYVLAGCYCCVRQGFCAGCGVPQVGRVPGLGCLARALSGSRVPAAHPHPWPDFLKFPPLLPTTIPPSRSGSRRTGSLPRLALGCPHPVPTCHLGPGPSCPSCRS